MAKILDGKVKVCPHYLSPVDDDEWWFG